jgi:hypothetical protein
MRAYSRGEFAIECRHFEEGHLPSWGQEFADAVFIDTREEIFSAVPFGKLSRQQGLRRLLTASSCFDAGRIFDDAIENIFPEPANG